MPEYSINAVTRRVVYTGSAGTGPYAFSFEVLVETDIAVYFNTTLLTLTTDYTVTINANGTGSVTIVVGTNVPTTPDADDQITIVGSRDIERTTDFVTAGDFRATAINEQLDSQIIMTQQVSEENARSIKAPVTDPTSIDMTLPSKDSRKGKYLAFNSTTGNPEAGASSDDVATLAAITDDIATLADIEDGTDATDAIQTVAGISSNVTTVAADGADIGTVAGISANVTTVAGISSDVTTVAANVTDVTNFADVYIGPSASDPTQRADTSALQPGDLYFNTTSNVMKVYTGSAWVEAALTTADFLQVANNLSDLNNAVTARTNLGVVIGSDVQAYDADTAKTDVAQTFTISQRGTITVDNDLSLDLSVTNNWKCTPTGTGTLTFTNHTAGQSGNILLDNSGGHAISLAATTKGDANLATTISTAGTYWLSYYDDGTNAYVVTSAVFA